MGLIAAVEPNLAPFISQRAVQSALEALLYSAAHPAIEPLLGLSLVDEQLTDPDTPRGAPRRAYALHTLLVDAITQAYNGQRASVGLAAVVAGAPVAALMAALAEDGRTGNHELLAWSVLYARYVRVDVGLQQPALADALSSNVRSIRRYQQHGVRRITERLTALEWETRHRRRKRRLALALPSSEPLRLFGREREVTALTDTLAQTPRHVILTGVAGIGKTALVQAFLHRLIADDALEGLVWLTDRPSADYVLAQVRAALLPPEANVEVRELLALRPTAVVLDDVSALWSDVAQFDALLQSLASALVYVTSTRYAPLSQSHTVLRLTEINREAAQALVHEVAASHDAADSDDLSEILWTAVGGHPLALTLLTRRTELLPALDGSDITQTVEPLYVSAYVTLTPRERHALYSVVAMPTGLVNVSDVVSIWQSLFSPSDLTALVRNSWVIRRSVEIGLVELPQSARHYLISRLAFDAAAQTSADALLDGIDQALYAGNRLAAVAAEHVLWTRDLPVPPVLRRDWLMRLWRTDAPVDTMPRWRVLLERALAEADVQRAALSLMLGVTLRRLGSWDDAGAALTNSIAAAGRDGEFLLQGEGLAELATLDRYRGAYESALDRLAKAERVARRHKAQTLLDAIALERAQIAVDLGDSVAAEAQLATLADSLRVLALKAEIRVMQGDMPAAEQFVSAAYDFLPAGDYAAEARLRTILGRAYQQVGAMARAREHFQAALTRLEQSADVFGLNRARGNLAAVLIELNDLDGAGRLLRAAEPEQLVLGDVAGLTATRHNAQIVWMRLTRRRR